MLRARAVLFTLTFLGFLYATISITNHSAGDIWTGLIMSTVGITGWIGCAVWEELR